MLSTASVSFLLDPHPFVSRLPRLLLPAAVLSRFSASSALLTRRDVLLMKMKGLLIFSLLTESRPRLLFSILLSIHRGSLPSDTTVSIFPDVLRAKAPPPRLSFSLFSSLFPVTCTIARGGNITFRIYIYIPDRSLRGMRQRALRAKLIQTGIMHASVSRVKIYEKKCVDVLIAKRM